MVSFMCQLGYAVCPVVSLDPSLEDAGFVDVINTSTI